MRLFVNFVNLYNLIGHESRSKKQRVVIDQQVYFLWLTHTERDSKEKETEREKERYRERERETAAGEVQQYSH